MSSKRTPAVLITATRVLVLCAILFSSTAGGVPDVSAVALASLSGWLYNTIDWPVDTSYAPSLAVDSSGRPHAAFVSGMNLNLTYRVFDGAAWQDQWISEGGAQYINLVLDDGDKPHITFLRGVGNGSALFYSHRPGDDWITEQLTTEMSAGQYNSLALDDAGRPHIAYLNQDENTIVYAHFDGTAWLYETAVSDLLRHAYSRISLALDTQEWPHIAYCYGNAVNTCTALKYAWFDGTAWNGETLDVNGGSISLTLDTMDRPHISYYRVNPDGSDPSLAYRYHDGSSWQVETVAAGAEGLYNMLRLDSAGRPQIAYYDQTGQDLEYAVREGSGWITSTVNDTGNTGLYPSFNLDASDRPHIAYVDVDESAVQYAGKPGLPDLVVNDIWVSEEGQVKASVQNAGLSSAQGLLQVTFRVDGVEHDPVNESVTLEPGDATVLNSPQACSGGSDVVIACVLMDPLAEEDDGNNCRQETVNCDSLPPSITAGPAAGSITQNSAVISWTTSEPANSFVKYAWQQGNYQNLVDNNFVSQHSITLTGLQANTHYAYSVRSTDNAGNKVESKLAFFRTLADPGTPPPPANFRAELKDPVSEMYGLKVNFADTSKILKVTFLVDGKPVGSDFSPNNGLFEVDLNPAELWPERSQFYRSSDPHQVQVQVTSASGTVTNYPFTFTPGFNARVINGYFITPEENRVIYIPGATAPAGSILGVNIYASQLEWNCDWTPGSGQSCEDLEIDAASVDFYVGTNQIGTATTTTRTHTFHFDWNIEGLAPGAYYLWARIYDADGNFRVVGRHISIETGIPSVAIERQVERDGNHFVVDLSIQNTSPAGVPVTLDMIYDSLEGFQPINGTYGNFTLSSYDWGTGIFYRVDINANQQVIQPGQSVQVQYIILPILYKDPYGRMPRIGVSTTVSYLVAGVNHSQDFHQEALEVSDTTSPGGLGSIQQTVGKVWAGSDYLIITSPQRMSELSWNVAKISKLLSDLAHLAVLKNGVLAYWPSNGSKDSLNLLLQDDSLWTNRLHANFEKRGKGYVLIVGETDIIPSFTKGPYEVNWPAGSDDSQEVRDTDNPYAHTDGNGAPDLLLGRIVGSTPERLDKAVQTSIRTHLGELSNDMSHVYLGSGTGNGMSTMQGDADTMQNYFASRGMIATKQHWESSAWLNEWAFAYDERDGFATGDLDGDGNDEIIIASCDQNAVYVIDNETGQLLSSFPLDFGDGNGFEGGDGLAAGDLDGDGKDEIIHADRADKVHIFTIQNNQWVMTKTFTLDFDSGDDIATGRVLLGHAGDQIVVADNGQNTISVHDQDGNLLAPAVNLRNLGYDISMYDQIAVGNVAISALGADEFIISNRLLQKILILGADGTLIKEMTMVIAWGDQLAAGDVAPDLGDEIIITDVRNSVQVYRGRNQDEALAYTQLRWIYKNVDSFDGLAIREVAGTSNDEIVFADRHDQIVTLDANYPEAARQAFLQAAPNQDLIWVFGHGSSSSVGPTLDHETFPVNFNGSAPIVTAISCLTGNYEDGGNSGLVVNFFNSGAGGYYGSTEISPENKNSNMSRKLFSEFWDAGEPLIKAIQEYKNHRWDVYNYYDWWYLVVNEYNYYGDPKFQLTSAAAVQPGSSQNELARSVQLEADTTIIQDLPDVSITSLEGIDYVEIPGGDEYLDKDQPIVPVYTITRTIPAGESVQDVRLVARGDRSEFSNLLLPLASAEPSSGLAQTEPPDVDPIPTWTPALEQPFTWSVNNEPGGVSTLILTIYPFRYNYEARYAEFYRHFEFQVSTILTGASIQAAATRVASYALGQDVDLHVAVENTGDPFDGVLSAAVYSVGGEAVGGFPLVFLPGLSGKGGADLLFSSAGLPAGDYFARVELLDSAGQVHDWREVYFGVGISSGEVTGLAPEKTFFEPGDQVTFTGQSRNTGDLPLDARLVLALSSVAGEYQVIQEQELAGIAPGGVVPFTFTWDSTGVDTGDYRLAVYLMYNSQTSVVKQAWIYAKRPVFLPLIWR